MDLGRNWVLLGVGEVGACGLEGWLSLRYPFDIPSIEIGLRFCALFFLEIRLWFLELPIWARESKDINGRLRCVDINI